MTPFKPGSANLPTIQIQNAATPLLNNVTVSDSHTINVQAPPPRILESAPMISGEGLEFCGHLTICCGSVGSTAAFVSGLIMQALDGPQNVSTGLIAVGGMMMFYCFICTCFMRR